jgi:hypothetical protein
MDHRVSFDESNALIRIVYHGSVSMEDVEQVRAEAIALTKQHAASKSLKDFRDASFDLTTLDIFSLPESTSAAYSEKQLSVHNIKRAIVMNKDAEALSFLETVSLNRGQRVKLFFEMDEAMSWLDAHE